MTIIDHRLRGGDGKLPTLFNALDAEREASQVVSGWRDYVSAIRMNGRLLSTHEVIQALGISRQRLHKVAGRSMFHNVSCRIQVFVPDVGWRWVWCEKGLTKVFGKGRLSTGLNALKGVK